MSVSYENLDKNDVHQDILSAGKRLYHVIENYYLYVQTELASHDSAHIEKIAQQRVDMSGTIIRRSFICAISRDRPAPVFPAQKYPST